MNRRSQSSRRSNVSRRSFLARAGAAAGAASIGAAALTGDADAAEGPTALKGNIKHSVVFWCFNVAGEMWDVEKTCQVSKQLGCKSIEIIAPEHWSVLKQHGLICALAPNGMPGAPFMKGLNNPKYHEEVLARTKKTIDDCADAGFPAVIAFTGYKWRDAEDPKSGEISLEEGADNTVRGLKELALYGEKKGVTVCIEHLNTRDSSHPMKGHPGYQGDDIDYVANICRRVGSPRAKLLFDIYHVQIMNGDVIRRIDQCQDVIGHIHTAGNPGRGELDEHQEIFFPPIMRKLVEINYQGYVGHEFIPTRDPLAGLKQAVQLCDV
ncbi:MAG: TIM barrel protein [Planctomycetes bacterium]|nr:TIM barrel protein [Planctomycetota bacterium]